VANPLLFHEGDRDEMTQAEFQEESSHVRIGVRNETTTTDTGSYSAINFSAKLFHLR
jgi:hypothetical protein